MKGSRLISYLLGLVLAIGLVGGLAGLGSQLALAQGEPQPPADNITLSAQYPSVQAKSGDTFTFTVDLNYFGQTARTFELTVDVPKDWVSTIQPQYDQIQISAIRLQAFQTVPDKVKVMTVPYPWALPNPGDYIIKFTASSGNLKASVDLKAVVTAKYDANLVTETGRLNTNADAGSENHLSIKLQNTGSAPLDKVNLTSSKPEGWVITYKPETIDSLAAGQTQDIDVTIKPPAKAIAGDYQITLTTSNKDITKNMDIRVTVLTPTIWGWAGIGIVLVVIGGLAVLFRQLGRR
ncbi:MAG: NEW3 domain-containing protein [Chloroflexota bacterium]|nr:NEW3 domain-containing protein [Chloroflexota bacterium]